jgi:hypothetical protein
LSALDEVLEALDAARHLQTKRAERVADVFGGVFGLVRHRQPDTGSGPRQRLEAHGAGIPRTRDAFPGDTGIRLLPP